MPESKDASFSSALNLLLLVTCPTPAILPAWYLLQRCQSAQHYHQAVLWAADTDRLCTLVVQRPVSAVAALYFGTGVVLFWTISLVQQSTWVRFMKQKRSSWLLASSDTACAHAASRESAPSTVEACVLEQHTLF